MCTIVNMHSVIYISKFCKSLSSVPQKSFKRSWDYNYAYIILYDNFVELLYQVLDPTCFYLGVKAICEVQTAVNVNEW